MRRLWKSPRQESCARLFPAAVHGRPHEFYRFSQTFKYRLTDKEMADVELDHLRQRRNGLCCPVVESMAGMHFQTKPRCALSTVTNTLPLGFRLTHTPFSQCITPAAGVDFDRGRA